MAEGGQDQTSGVADVTPTSLSSGKRGSAILAEGEKVNLKFAKSTINVVTGYQINANKVVFDISGAEGEATTTNQGFATLAEGENVNQNFIKSKVKVVAGDEIHGNKFVK